MLKGPPDLGKLDQTPSPDIALQTTADNPERPGQANERQEKIDAARKAFVQSAGVRSSGSGRERER